MSTALTVVMVSWVFAYVQTYPIVHIKYVQFFVYQWYLNKGAKIKSHCFEWVEGTGWEEHEGSYWDDENAVDLDWHVGYWMYIFVKTGWAIILRHMHSLCIKSSQVLWKKWLINSYFFIYTCLLILLIFTTQFHLLYHFILWLTKHGY